MKALQRRGCLGRCGALAERYLARADDEEAGDVAATVVVPLEGVANGTGNH